MSTLTQTTLKLVVDYGKAVGAMIQAGKYGYANSDVTAKNFPSQGKGTAQLEGVLFHPDRYVESEEVLAELDKMGLRAGTLQELLALGAQHPDEQKKYPIVALGSVWRRPDGRRCVPCLNEFGGRRLLSLDWFALGWLGSYRFLAVRK